VVEGGINKKKHRKRGKSPSREKTHYSKKGGLAGKTKGGGRSGPIGKGFNHREGNLAVRGADHRDKQVLE